MNIKEFKLLPGENKCEPLPPSRVDRVYVRDLRARKFNLIRVDPQDFDKLEKEMRGTPTMFKREPNGVCVWPRASHEWTIVVEYTRAVMVAKEQQGVA